MHHATWVLFKRQGLEPQEVFILRNVNINQSEPVTVGFEDIGIGGLANLALKLLPHVAHMGCLFLDCHLLLEPELEAFVMNIADRSVTLAWVEQRVSPCLDSIPANLALYFTAFARFDHTTVDLNSFFGIEIVVTIFVIRVVLSCLTVTLLNWRGTPVNHTFSLQVAVGRLGVRSEVFDAELQTA